MGKVAKILPKDKLAESIKNGIPYTTVYKRIQRGWSVDRAVSEPSIAKYGDRDRIPTGEFKGNGRGRCRHFTYFREYDEELDKAITASGLSQSDFIAMLLLKYFKHDK